MALDEATSALLQQMSASGIKPLHEMTVEEGREFSRQSAGRAAPGPEMAKVEGGRISVDGGFVPFRLFYPVEKPAGIIVYFHGGGWVSGGLEQSDPLGRILAKDTGCAVMVVDYRLAPEFRYPTAVNDAYDAFRYAATLAETISDEPVPVILYGDSAGGNLVAVTAQRAKHRHGPRIALQVLVYPVLDCDFDTTSYTDPENDLVLSRDAMKNFWDLYAPDAGSRTHPDASPLRGQNLGGLPPAVIVTAEHDVLRDEAELYATFLLKEQVPVRHLRAAGQMHGFLTLRDLLPGSKVAIDFIVDEINNAIEENNDVVKEDNSS